MTATHRLRHHLVVPIKAGHEPFLHTHRHASLSTYTSLYTFISCRASVRKYGSQNFVFFLYSQASSLYTSKSFLAYSVSFSSRSRKHYYYSTVHWLDETEEFCCCYYYTIYTNLCANNVLPWWRQRRRRQRPLLYTVLVMFLAGKRSYPSVFELLLGEKPKRIHGLKICVCTYSI